MMDRKYIEREQITQRYLTGDLTVREAREFEQYCLDHPEILKDMPIPVRLKARLARKPSASSDTGVFKAIPSSTSVAVSEAVEEGYDAEEDEEEVRRIYGGPSRNLVFTLAFLIVLAAGAAVWFALRAHDLEKRVGMAQHDVRGTLPQPVASSQEYSLEITRSGPPASPTLSLGWPQPPVLLEMKANVSASKFNVYLITIDSESAGRMMQFRRVARDSNGDLKFAFNSSAFGPGIYTIKLDGYTWRGQTEEYGWVKIALQ